MLGNGDVYLLAGAHIGNPGGQYEDEYAFTVGIDHSASTIKDVTSIAFTTPNVTLDAGEDLQLSVTVTPNDASNQNITYQSSNVNVVTVNESGLISAVGIGTATITARLEGKTATCEITVEAGNVDATGIELDHETLTLEQFMTGELTATVLPSYAANKDVIWTDRRRTCERRS
ncbi:MAG: Ig-like domain-containing protein [Bacillus subtilis]|nr:Ig-like domain-containing protein [Bacillus subtilis]